MRREGSSSVETSRMRPRRKLRAAAEWREDRRLRFAVQVEGGVIGENLEALVQAGADILVIGSAIFDSDEPKVRLGEFIRLAAGAQQVAKV